MRSPIFFLGFVFLFALIPFGSGLPEDTSSCVSPDPQEPPSTTTSFFSSLPRSTLVLAFILLLILLRRLFLLWKEIRSHPRGILAGIVEKFTSGLTMIPGVSSVVDSQAAEFTRQAISHYASTEVTEDSLYSLPRQGFQVEELKRRLKRYLFEFGNRCWKTKKISGACYMTDDDAEEGRQHLEACVYAMTLYCDSNALHFECFPAIAKFEREIIRMAKGILHAGDLPEVVGLISTGGTESIILSVLAHREYGFQTRGITRPNLVCPNSLHCAFDKACHMLRIELRKVDCDPETFKVDLQKLKAQVDSNTILIAASAPCYPHGIIDPIEEIGKFALKKNVPFHVDSCLGGFYLPFLRMGQERLGQEVTVPPFDFEVEGVTAMSADTHKFGMAPKGSSVVLFRGKEIRNCAFFHTFDWPGGHYATGTLLGSRSGASIAAAWTSLVHIGLENFVKITSEIQEQVRVAADRVKTLDGLEIMGEPTAMIIAMRTTIPQISPYQVMDEMKSRGWKLQGLQLPPSFHMMFNAKHVDGMGLKFADDLEASWKVVVENPKAHAKDSAALYGSAVVAPASILSQVALGVLAYTLDGETKPAEEEEEEEKGE